VLSTLRIRFKFISEYRRDGYHLLRSKTYDINRNSKCCFSSFRCSTLIYRAYAKAAKKKNAGTGQIGIDCGETGGTKFE